MTIALSPQSTEKVERNTDELMTDMILFRFNLEIVSFQAAVFYCKVLLAKWYKMRNFFHTNSI